MFLASHLEHMRSLVQQQPLGDVHDLPYQLLLTARICSGVMRITVTVVVIMFELTGALTYILPTMVWTMCLPNSPPLTSVHLCQIVLLVTKAVGDFLGTNGIADEMIRFNGYPFLEKEDHAFNVSVSKVMKKDLHALPVSGMRVRVLEEKLASTDVKGFPLVSSEPLNTLMGYIGRTELRYVLGESCVT